MVALALAAACANDFDALFDPKTSPEAGVDAGDGGTVANDANTEAGVDAGGDAAPRCSPTTTVCPIDGGCDSDDEDCKVQCLGCECPCSYTTPKKPRNDDPSFVGTCSGGSKCTLSCPTGGPCEARATDSDLTFTCNDLATKCTARCEGKSNKCDVTCDIDGDCSLECRDNAPCFLSCGANTTKCELDCKSGNKKECGSAKKLACNRECP